MNFDELIDKANLTEEQKTIAKQVFGIDSLTSAISGAAKVEAETALSARRTELETNWAEANREYLAMQDKVANAEATAGELAKARKDLAEATEKLKVAAPNIDLAKLTDDITKVVTEKAGVLELGARAMELDALECISEHQDLFGQRLSVRQLVQDALAAKRPVTDYWQEKYNVPAKRTEIAKAAHDKEILDAEERGRKLAMAESAHPFARPLVESKSPFWVPKDAAAKEGVDPWNDTSAPPEEAQLLGELQAARG